MEMMLIIRKEIANREEGTAFAKLIKQRMPELIGSEDQIVFTISSKEKIDIRSDAISV